MQITREETGALTSTIKLTIGKEDYEQKVNKTLKDYQHKANIPGFRPGKVPFGLISKMYRKGVLLDEINHLLSHNLQNYIQENKLDLIGSPVANKEKTTDFDPDLHSEFEFYFDIGLAPEFDLDLTDKISVDHLRITATEKMVDEQIHQLQHRMAEHAHNEEHAGEEEHHDETLPELNEQFFSRVFPGEEIKTEKDFRDKIKDSIEQSLVRESERYFLNSVIEKLVKETKFELPQAFIEKMIRENDESKLSEEDLARQLENLTNSIRWQLIESRLIRDHNLRVDDMEMRSVIKGYFTGNIADTAEDPEREERLNKIIDSVLSNKDEADRLHDQLFEKKLLQLFRDKLNLENKEMDYDEFIKLVTQKKA